MPQILDLIVFVNGLYSSTSDSTTTQGIYVIYSICE